MSYSKQITLWCDYPNCEQWDMFSTSHISVARKEAKNTGWIYTHDRKDICPKCTKQIKGEEK